MITDLDRFKSINDAHGHDGGDEVLREFARRLRKNVRGIDLACRFGGEEFVVVMPDTEAKIAEKVAERVRAERGARVKATVLVRPKAGILDPQGEAVESSLRQLGFPVGETRIGRVIDLDVEAATADEARNEIQRMCERLLANPLIESYEIEVAE